jgi:hypothetical protein
MAKSVINLSEPFFLKVLSLVNQPATNPEQLPQLQRQLSGDLQAIEQKVASGNASVSPAEWQSLKKVLVYWADEVLTAHIPDWEDYVLEQEYSSALSQTKSGVESFAGKGGQVPKMQSTLRAVPVFGT